MTNDLSRLISEEAERLDSYYQVTRAFAESLGRVLRGTGWTVAVDLDLDQLGFRVHLSKPSWSAATVEVERFVSDEELNRNAESKDRFSKYVRSLAWEMREEGGESKEQQQRLDEGGWYEATGKGAGGFLTQQVRDRNHQHGSMPNSPHPHSHFTVSADGVMRDFYGRPVASKTPSPLRVEAQREVEVRQEEELDVVASVAESLKRLDERRDR